MNHLELGNLIRKCLDDFYQRRASILSTLRLRDIVGNNNLYLVHSVRNLKLTKFVEGLIYAHLSSRDEGVIGQLQWEKLAEYNDFYEIFTSLSSSHTTEHSFHFTEELCKAINRFEHDFLINFGNADGSINWARLLQFNSGKEKMVWISQVQVIETVEEDLNEEEDSNK